MARNQQLSTATGINIYFADRSSPWQRVGFQKSACAADLGDQRGRLAGMIVRRVVAPAVLNLPSAAEPAVVAGPLVDV
jgi:hypothetical protein